MSQSTQSVQNRTFLGAISAAIKAFCLLFIRATEAANTGVSIASRAVEKAEQKQLIDSTIEMRDYENAAVYKAAVERQKVREAMAQYLSADTTGQRKQQVEEEIKSLRAAIQAERARLTAENE